MGKIFDEARCDVCPYRVRWDEQGQADTGFCGGRIEKTNCPMEHYQRGLSEGRKQGLMEAVAILKTNRGKPCTDLNVDWHEGYDDALDWGIDAIEAAAAKEEE